MDALESLRSSTGSRGLLGPLGGWQVALLVLLANYTYSFSYVVTFRTEFLVIPLAVWLAHRYGRHGFRSFAYGGLVLWLSLYYGRSGFALSPDAYLVALLAALAVAYPHRWLTLLDRVRVSAGTPFLLFGLIPLQVVLDVENLKIGWTPGIFLSFCFFLLGYSGAPVKRLLWLLAVFSLIGNLLTSQNLYIRDDEFQLIYRIIGIKSFLIYSICLLGGALLNEVKTLVHHHPQQRTIWYRKPSTIYLVGLIMVIAPISMGIKLWDTAIPLWGSKWLLVFGAFLAGVLWRQTGIQLTLAAIGGTSILTMLVVPELSDYLVIKSPDFALSITHLSRSFPQEALFSLLYAYIGHRASGFLLSPTEKEQPHPNTR